MGFFDDFKGKTKAEEIIEDGKEGIKIDGTSSDVLDKLENLDSSTAEKINNLAKDVKTPDELHEKSNNDAKFIADAVQVLSSAIPEKDVTIVVNKDDTSNYIEVKHANPRKRNTSAISNKKNDEENEELKERKRFALMNTYKPDLNSEDAVKDEIQDLSTIRTSWRDYTLMMLNSTAEPLRSIWREKIVTSMSHWTFEKGSISEGNIDGMEILTVLPSELTEKIVNDHFEEGELVKLNRLAGSKRMNVHIGHYPQESTSNEANLCLKYIVNNYDKVIFINKKVENDEDPRSVAYECFTGKDLIMNIPLIRRMWDVAQKTGGMTVSNDEVLTYNLEKPVDDSHYGVWLDVTEDVAENGRPSDKYDKYWKLDRIENYPLAEYVPDADAWFSRNVLDGGTVELKELSLEDQKKNFLNMCDMVLKEDVAMCCCWKKIAICILKNDVTMKYAGFSATLKERQAREEAMAAFSTKQDEKAKAKENAEALARKIEKENMEKNK